MSWSLNELTLKEISNTEIDNLFWQKSVILFVSMSCLIQCCHCMFALLFLQLPGISHGHSDLLGQNMMVHRHANCFTVSLHSPNDRQFACHCKGTVSHLGNSYHSHEAINSLRWSDTNMHQYNIPTLENQLAWENVCRLFGAKPLSEPMLPYCQLHPAEHISVKFYIKFKRFHSRECTWRCRLQNGDHFVWALMC